MGVVGGHAVHPGAGRQLGQGVVARRVERIAVVPQLDQHPVASEGVDHPQQLTARRRRPVGDQRRGHGTLAATGERPHLPGGRVGDVGEGELRRPLLPRQVAEADRLGQPGIPRRPVGEQHEVTALWIGGVAVGHLAGRRLGGGRHLAAGDPRRGIEPGRQGDLGAEHRRHAHGPRRLGEAHHAVEAVVIGERERFETEPGSLHHQLLRVRGAVEEGEVGVAVQLGVRHRTDGAGQPGGVEGLAVAGPRRAVAARVPRRANRGRDRRGQGRRAPSRFPTVPLPAGAMSTMGC